MSTTGLSRRDFFKGAAAGTMGVAALGALGGCAPSNAKSATSSAGEANQPGTYDVMAELSTYNRGENPDKTAAATPEEFII